MDAPKVCYLQPGALAGEAKALCGENRKGVDAITEDPGKVTCAACNKWVKEGLAAAQNGTQVAAAKVTAPPPPASADPLAAFQSLTSEALGARLRKAEGDVAALKVLLEAVRAREKAEQG